MSQELSHRDFAESLNEYRRELDALDAQLVSLLAARFAVTRRIGALKAEHGVSAADPARERAQLERLLSLSGDLELPAELTRAIYDSLFRFVRESHRAQAASANLAAAEVESNADVAPSLNWK